MRPAAAVLAAALVAACGSKGRISGGDDAGPAATPEQPPKVSKPGDMAIGSLKKVKEPRAVVFFPPGPVADQVVGYLTDLGDKAGVPFEVRELDRLIDVEQAKRFKVVRDGVVVLVSGDLVESIELHADGADAEADLARLDAKMARGMTRLGRGRRTVALVVHQVADVARFLVLDQALAALGFETTTISPGKDVPPGAVAIVLDVGAGPTRPAMESIDRHLAAGGAALVAIEPRKGAALGPLEARLGLRLVAGARKVTSAQLAAHPSTATASRVGAIQLAGAGALEEVGAPPAGTRRVVTIRAATAPQRPIAAAASGPFKAIVIADAGWLSDDLLRNAPADQALLVDAMRWLAGEEEFSAEGIDQPATGDRLTTYPVRTVQVAGGRGALWKVPADGVHGVRYETRGRVILLERKRDGLWGRVERPSADGGGAAAVREFPLAPEAANLFAALAEPVSLRAVGPLDATTRARYGLEDGTLTVDLAGGATHTVMVGSRVMGSGDRYAADAAGRSVVILPASLIDPIDQTDRIALRQVLDLDPEQLSRLVVARGDRTRDAVKAADGGWKVAGGDSEDAYLAEEIARAAFRLTPTEFAPAERAKEMTAAGRVSLTAGSAAPVDLELFTRSDEFWIRTPLTRGLFGRVSAGSARRIADAVAQLAAQPP